MSTAWKREAPWLAAVFGVALWACWPLFGQALPATHDGLIHLLRIHQFVGSLQAGVMYPRWAPDVAYGYGAPIFSYYPPLTYYVAAGIRSLGFGWVETWQVFGIVALAGSAVTMYAFARSLFPAAASAVASIAYLLAPYHLIDLYTRGTLPETFAFVWLPLVFLGLERVCRDAGPGWRSPWPWFLAAAFGALLLTHLITALMFAPLFLLWGIGALWRSRPAGRSFGWYLGNRSPFWRLAASVVGALGLAAVYMVPAAVEQRLVKIERTSVPENDVGFFPIIDYFRSGIVQYWDFANIQRFMDGSVNLVLLILAIAGVGALVLGRRRLKPGVVWYGVICFIASAVGLALVDPLTKPVWDALGGASLVWFPFRMMAIVAFAWAVLAGIAVTTLPRFATPVAAAAALAITLSILPTMRPVPSGITDLLVSPQGITAFENLNGTITLTATGEFLPATADENITRSPLAAARFSDREPPTAFAGSDTWAAQVWGVRSRSIDIEARGPVTVELFAFPPWRTALDGAPVQSQPSPKFGLVEIAAQGVHRLTIDFQPSLLATATAWISGVGWTVVVLVLVLLGIRARPRWELLAAGFATAAAMLALTAVAFRGAYPMPRDDSSLTFPGGGFARIQGPGLMERLQPGDTVFVEIEGRLRPEQSRLLVELVGDQRAWSTVEIEAPGGQLRAQVVGVPIPFGAPGGPYAVQVSLPDPKLELSPTGALARSLTNTTLGEWRTLPFVVVGGPGEPAGGARLRDSWEVGPIAFDRSSGVRAGEVLRASGLFRAVTPNSLQPGYELRFLDAGGVVQHIHAADLADTARRGRGWLAGDTVRLGLDAPLPATLPPGQYQVRLSFFDSEGTIPLAPIDVGSLSIGLAARFPPLSELSKTPNARVLDVDGIRAIEVLPNASTARLGDTLQVEVLWHVVDPPDRDFEARIQVTDRAGNTARSTASAVAGVAPTSALPDGASFWTTYAVPLPTTLQGTDADIRLELVAPDGRRAETVVAPLRLDRGN